ncbi:substrate import-associated zinc metallohydrolase lipoprotein [Ekhidna lutea]|uniref:Substrate import-associated zinc metallohydrolase lipoprotein n=1 Tax=Ekhidna lutea TaxID=447679 RepID=A0A239GJY8_EKHLU|nr:substrate import-associated zinc metallohydrolase lipoprotein [Ekhidna lutea]SNS69088.1 substrate import-associated zinc metallohydrolase lipoprotein [Ekhidna lutea]
MIGLLIGCYPSEELNVPVKDPEIELESDLDIYIEENFTQEYGMAIRYKFVDNYVQPDQRVSPPRLEVVRPMLDFIEEYWINPYKEVENGEHFFRNHVPAEIVFLGGLIFNNDGTVTLGTADAGAQITFTNVNAIDVDDEDWLALQLQTVYHEFAHTVHQRYKLPNAFETIAPAGYTGPGSWFVLTDEEALQRGFVTPYSTSSPNEDFAEVVALYLYDPDFHENFIEQESNCETDDCVSRNEGKMKIAEKLSAISDHYQNVTGVSLEGLRQAIQSRL